HEEGLEHGDRAVSSRLWDWPPDRDGPRRGSRRCNRVQKWSPICRLAGPCPPPAFYRWEDNPTRDDEARESLPPHPPHPWCPRGATGRRSQDGSPESLAPRGQSPTREALCQRRTGQQDRTDRLGVVGEG